MFSRRASGTECKPRKASSQRKLPPHPLPFTAKTGKCSGQLPSPPSSRRRGGSDFYAPSYQTVRLAECGSEPGRKPHSEKRDLSGSACECACGKKQSEILCVSKCRCACIRRSVNPRPCGITLLPPTRGVW